MPTPNEEQVSILLGNLGRYKKESTDLFVSFSTSTPVSFIVRDGTRIQDKG